MRTYLGWLLAAVALPLTAYAQEATVKEVHDKPPCTVALSRTFFRSMTIRSRSIRMTPTT
jgi:hypothetical protein